MVVVGGGGGCWCVSRKVVVEVVVVVAAGGGGGGCTDAEVEADVGAAADQASVSGTLPSLSSSLLLNKGTDRVTAGPSPVKFNTGDSRALLHHFLLALVMLNLS